MLISHRDNLIVVSPDLVKIRDTLEERGTVSASGHRPVISQCQDCDRMPGLGEDIDALMTVLQGQVDASVTPKTTSPGQK